MRTHPLELLTKAATAEPGSVYEHIGAGGRQRGVALNSNDYLAMVRAALPQAEDQSSMLLLKYGDGGNNEWLWLLRSTWHELHRIQNERLLREHNKKNKPTRIPEATLNAITVAAVAEHLDTHTCKRCNGTREAWINDRCIICESCAGNGIVDWTAERRAQAILVSRSTYYRLLWLYMPALQH